MLRYVLPAYLMAQKIARGQIHQTADSYRSARRNRLANRSVYRPHQGAQECARRVAQAQKNMANAMRRSSITPTK